MRRFLSIAAILILLGAGGSASVTGPLQPRASPIFCEYWECYESINGQKLTSSNGPAGPSSVYLLCTYQPIPPKELYFCQYSSTTGIQTPGTVVEGEPCPSTAECFLYSKRGLRSELDGWTPMPAATMLTQQEVEDLMPW